MLLVSYITGRDYPRYTHGYPEVDPYPYPLKTHTRTHGYGLLDRYHSHGCGLRPVADIPVDDGRAIGEDTWVPHRQSPKVCA